MLPKIIIAGFKDFSRLANQILKEIHIPIPVNIETVGLPLEIFDKSNVDLQTHFEPATILIAGDRSALLLEEKLNNVVIPVKISGFDLLEIIDRHCSSKVVRILNFKEELVQVQKVSHLLNVEIIQHQFRDLVQFHEVVEKLKEAGVTEVIGGSFVCDQMPKFGIKGISYYSKRSMIEAIHTAINFIKIYRKEMEQAALFKTIVNMNKSGIISTDRENKINVVSPSAEKLLSLKQEKILKKNIHSVIKEFQNFSTTNNSIFFKWNNKQLVAEITPVNIANDKVGNIIVVEDIQEIQKSEMKIREKINEKPLRAQYTFNDIMGSSPVIELTKKIAKKYSQVDSAILLQGESGTGKELFAQAIHNESNRRDGPFVAINCAALPESLLDSELFGYEEGHLQGRKRR